MKILITGICGFVGSNIARELLVHFPQCDIMGIDNFSRSGSFLNQQALLSEGIEVFVGDIRMASDMESLPAVDWVIDAAAMASVLSGVNTSSPRLLLEHNLQSTFNVLEYCRKHQAGLILISTSRVYSVDGLMSIPVTSSDHAFVLDQASPLPVGVSPNGINTTFSTQSPISLYGASKLASETLALEYGNAFDFPVWINRCGVLAGAGQFGLPDQGIVSFWVNSWLQEHPLKYIGFSGTGFQVRDCFHPRDLSSLLIKQIEYAGTDRPRVLNLGGGLDNTFSLRQLSNWCQMEIGNRIVNTAEQARAYDAPWIVMDNTNATDIWNWAPQTTVWEIFEETLGHAKKNPNWLQISRAI
jgi:CDP-paratose 2-epimerase